MVLPFTAKDLRCQHQQLLSAVQVLMLMATEEKSDATLFAMQQAQQDQLQDQLHAMDVSLALDVQHMLLSAAPAQRLSMMMLVNPAACMLTSPVLTYAVCDASH